VLVMMFFFSTNLWFIISGVFRISCFPSIVCLEIYLETNDSFFFFVKYFFSSLVSCFPPQKVPEVWSLVHGQPHKTEGSGFPTSPCGFLGGAFLIFSVIFLGVYDISSGFKPPLVRFKLVLNAFVFLLRFISWSIFPSISFSPQK